MRRCKIGFINFLWKLSNSLLTCCVSFPRAQSASFLISILNSYQGGLEVRTAVSSDFILQNLIMKDVFIVILKEKCQNSCGKKLLDAFFLFLSSQERAKD